MRSNSKTDIRTVMIGAAMLVAGVALLSVSVSVRASAIDLQQRHQFKIPSESLNAALSAFSTESHIRVVASGVSASVLSSGVSGHLSVLSALSTLLRGTGTSFRQLDAETIVVVPTDMGQVRPTAFQLVGPAYQEALADQPSTAAAPTAGAELSEVQVTGTRIVRQGYEAPTPVTAVGIQALQDAAQPNLGDTLTELPVFQNSQTNANSTLNDSEGDATELNLRNLGPQRTLILFDGRRLPASNIEEVPDVSLLPSALIQRVDVVTGGASAVYGSDAVAGVVNFVLDTSFTGVKGLVQAGESMYFVGPSDEVQLTFGSDFGGSRWHFLLSGDQQSQGEILGTSLPWNTTGESTIENPNTSPNAPEFILEPCCVSKPGYYPGGVILTGPLAGTSFGPGGAVGQYKLGYGLGFDALGTSQYGGDWKSTLAAGATDTLASVNATHAFARLAYDLTPDIQVYAEFINGQNHTYDRCCPNYYPTGVGVSGLQMSATNPFLPASVAANLAASGQTGFVLGEDLIFPDSEGIHGMIGTRDDRTNDIYAFGFKGKVNLLKSSWNWDFYAQQGIAIQNLTSPTNTNKSNFINALNAVTVTPGNVGTSGLAIGSITCASNLLPKGAAGATSDCVAYNPFGIGVESQAAIDYIQGTPWMREVEATNMLGGDLSGEPFSDWAGPVSVAVDAEYRREGIDGDSDANSRAANYFSVNYFAFDARQNVEEGAVETVVPLLKDKPFVKELDANGAARATDYSTSGYVTSWKYGLEYTPVNDLRFRLTESEDIRAPNLNDLYGYSTGHGEDEDPAEGFIFAPDTSVTAGNPTLKPEKSHSTVVGLVFQPTEIPGLNLSIDYWRINIASAIATYSNFYQLDTCYNNPASPLCKDIVRNPNGSLNSVIAYGENIGSFLGAGVDYQLDYRKQLAEFVPSWKGTVDFGIKATNTIHNIQDTGIPGPSEVFDNTGTADVPRWGILGTLTYDSDRWRLVWTERYASAVSGMNASIVQGATTGIYIQCSTNCPNPIPSGFDTIGFNPRVPTYFLANLSVQYKLTENSLKEATVFLNLNNVFNKAPPFANSDNDYGFDQYIGQTLYDRLGLYATAGLRFRL